MSREQEDVSTDHEKIMQLRRDLTDLIAKIDSAFIRDEQGFADYSGHKAVHKEQEEKAKGMKQAKASIIKNIISWALIGALTVIGSTLAQAYIVPVLSITK